MDTPRQSLKPKFWHWQKKEFNAAIGLVLVHTRRDGSLCQLFAPIPSKSRSAFSHPNTVHPHPNPEVQFGAWRSRYNARPASAWSHCCRHTAMEYKSLKPQSSWYFTLFLNYECRQKAGNFRSSTRTASKFCPSPRTTSGDAKWRPIANT